MVCSWRVPDMFFMGSWCVLDLFLTCSWTVLYILMLCSWRVPDMFLARSWRVLAVFLKCVLDVLQLCAAPHVRTEASAWGTACVPVPTATPGRGVRGVSTVQPIPTATVAKDPPSGHLWASHRCRGHCWLQGLILTDGWYTECFSRFPAAHFRR